MDLYFSQVFSVSEDVLEEYGALDVSVVSDLPAFIDPFLLFNSEKEEYQELHEQILKYLVYLRDRAAVIRELFRLDLVTRPLPDPALRPTGPVSATCDSLGHQVWRHDEPSWLDQKTLDDFFGEGRVPATPALPPRQESVVEIYYPDGFSEIARSTNHETSKHFVGRVRVRST